MKSPNLRHCWPAHRTKNWANTRWELASSRQAHPLLEAGGRWAAARARKGHTRPQRWHPPPNCKHAPSCQPSLPGILDGWHPPGGLQPEISSPEETHGTSEMAHSGNWVAGTREVIRCTPTWGESTHQTPGCLSCSNLGRAQNAGPTESVPLWNTQEPEPEQLRPGRSTQPRAYFRQFPCRATWSLSSVDWESTHTVSGGKPSVAKTLRALPTYASDICLQCTCLSAARVNKWA